MAIIHSELHAERSLVLYKLRFNRRGKRNDTLDPLSLDGRSAAGLFKDFCGARQADVAQVARTDKFVTITACQEYDGGSLASYYSGRAGENGRIVNTITSSIEHSYGGNSAPMTESRVYIRVMPGVRYAIACVEHVNGSAGDTVLLVEFRKYLRDAAHDIVLAREQILMPEALEAFTSVENVEFRSYVERADVADNVVRMPREDDFYSIKLNHRRRNPFPLSYLTDLIKDRSSVRTMFGVLGNYIDPQKPGSSIFVTVKDRNGSTRRFTLGDSFEVPLREVLNPINTPPLGDEEFVTKCNEKCDYAVSAIGREA